MKHVMNKWLALVLALAMVLSISACGGNSAGENDAAGNQSSGLGIPSHSPAAPQTVQIHLFMSQASRKRGEKSSVRDLLLMPPPCVPFPGGKSLKSRPAFPPPCENLLN